MNQQEARNHEKPKRAEAALAEERVPRREFAIPRRRVCFFCAQRIDPIDFKQADLLRQYITDRGRIKTRRKTAVCARHQRQLARAIKRARYLALLPFTAERLQAS